MSIGVLLLPHEDITIMADKNSPKRHTPKGRAYCETPGTVCTYNTADRCINCLRMKGWRKMSEADRLTIYWLAVALNPQLLVVSR